MPRAAGCWLQAASSWRGHARTRETWAAAWRRQHATLQRCPALRMVRARAPLRGCALRSPLGEERQQQPRRETQERSPAVRCSARAGGDGDAARALLGLREEEALKRAVLASLVHAASVRCMSQVALRRAASTGYSRGRVLWHGCTVLVAARLVKHSRFRTTVHCGAPFVPSSPGTCVGCAQPPASWTTHLMALKVIDADGVVHVPRLVYRRLQS